MGICRETGSVINVKTADDINILLNDEPEVDTRQSHGGKAKKGINNRGSPAVPDRWAELDKADKSEGKGGKGGKGRDRHERDRGRNGAYPQDDQASERQTFEEWQAKFTGGKDDQEAKGNVKKSGKDDGAREKNEAPPPTRMEGDGEHPEGELVK